ncbi:MAG TPA: serine/threonine-protein kinase [Actinomycetota bacterium]
MTAWAPLPEDPGLVLGAHLGAYRLDGFLGQGAMAFVFRATDTRTGRVVALKVLKRKLATDPVYLRRFVHEARAAGAVQNPYLVPILEAGEAVGRPFLAAAFVGGRSLAERLRQEGPLPLPDVLRISAQAGNGFDALHRFGLIHRDIKPSNILLDPNGDAAVTDFGLAKGPAYTVLTNPGQVMGTLDYLAPELIRGGKGTPASDLYAFGCVIYECLAGRAPFGEKSMFQLAQAVLNEQPPDPTVGRPDLPPQLYWVLLQALAKLPAHRPPSCSVFAQMLANCTTPFAP